MRLQVGRPVFYGLAARGAAGARHVIEMLNKELELAMERRGGHQSRPRATGSGPCCDPATIRTDGRTS
jgi:hypothetical protein